MAWAEVVGVSVEAVVYVAQLFDLDYFEPSIPVVELDCEDLGGALWLLIGLIRPHSR